MQQVLTRVTRSRFSLSTLKPGTIFFEHISSIFLYMSVGIGITWPLVLNFNTRLIGDGANDVKHSVWIIWNFLQSVQFRSTPFYTNLLYYPKGVSLLLDGAGPLSGLFSLPFWIFGPVAAYNGTILFSIVFSGYCMYLFARSLGFKIGPALFAGLVLQLGPAHLAGVYGHLEKTFVGLLPLILLALHKALNLNKSRWWCLATAVGMLLIAFYSGYQFIIAGLGVAFFYIVILLAAQSKDRLEILKRGAIIIAISIIIIGPLLIGIVIDSRNPETSSNVAVNTTAPFYEPDVVQYILPPFYNAFFAPLVYNYPPGGSVPTNTRFGGFNASSSWYGVFIETSVTLSITALVLCFFALRFKFKPSRRWLLFTLCCIILSLGPTLRFLGTTTFTVFKLPIILPFAFLDSLPGLEFMRASGRIMMLGTLGLGISAAYGLSWLTQRWPRKQNWIVAGCIVLLLFESWPRPWVTTPLPGIPTFYQQLATDKDTYGVLDIPFAWGPADVVGGWNSYAATYQMYQMAHHKPIAWGYLSHTYNSDKYPISFINQLISSQKIEESNLSINGNPVNTYNQQQLSENNFRYVVYHKTLFYTPQAKEHILAQQYIAQVFGANAKPYYEDDMVRVYKVEQVTTDTSNPKSISEFKLGSNWRGGEENHRWATTPATVEITSTIGQDVTMEINPVAVFDPNAKGLGRNGVLLVSSDKTPQMSVPITIDNTVSIPVKLQVGKNKVTLALQAGNFQPSQYGGKDNSIISFAISKINLVTNQNQ